LTAGGRLAAALALVGLATTSTIALGADQGAMGSSLTQAQAALAQGHPGEAASELRRLAAVVPAAESIAEEIAGDHLSRARGQLQLLLRASSAASPTPAAVGGALARVYASSQLAGLGRPAPRGSSLLSDLANFLRQLLLDLFAAGGRLLWSLLALVTLAAGAVVAVVLIQRSRGRLPNPAGEAGSEPGLPARERPERLFARADQLRLEGRFREAVRASFRALLISAGEHRVLEVDPSWTNSELLQAARQVADLEPALRPLVAQFNAVVYGGRDPGSSGCSQFNAACRAAAGGLSR